ncbi:2-nitropropane dioxygenase [Actinoalloteichus sp. AHMU CJ021]|uniref:PfaD family protein n=1 Tax=Actinoalloteichus caeruleus DSM 43889 TaxID=1120930 RepID=A0ABT1JP23_ACTCY|nr:PfaD family polyunsaturated fatty acid/polyketide biosynthesis protein [Actinoalloteichus caeruleus]AUS80083.1 2-nitropropane dioxygenase [Actinoalloteichus sp. AHMU CJ021]MCP2334282.1 PfaD family protein [Actinoalloteichus caeruleus DSM 43889]
MAVSPPHPSTNLPTWRPAELPPAFTAHELPDALHRIREPLHVVRDRDGHYGLGVGGGPGSGPHGYPLVGSLPPSYPEWLGDRSFLDAHGVRFPYVAGEMANGIAGTRMVTALARADLLGFLGAAGLGLTEVGKAVDELVAALPGRRNWGVNLIHSPAEPDLERAVAELLLDREVPCVSVSAFMDLTPTVVRCAATGLRRGSRGEVLRRTRMFAKVSRPETAALFLAPAPDRLLRGLVDRGELTPEEAALAATVPVAEDVTVEGDSGGHTDNRPLGCVLPVVLGLRDELTRRHGYRRPVRVGAAGGLGTPEAVAAAFALGAAYVVTGSVNQASVEANLSREAKDMLAKAEVTDVTMAPAADMFELGISLQVLRRGTLFPSRAGRLRVLYESYPCLEALPGPVRDTLEREVLHASLDEVWARTRRFWERRNPAELVRAEGDPRHRMALVFRWYLGSSSRWAIEGAEDRRLDYQLWCGPAMGAFNRWAADGWLADPENRSVVQIARNLLEGAAVVTRAHQARTLGVPVPAHALRFRSRPLG